MQFLPKNRVTCSIRLCTWNTFFAKSRPISPIHASIQIACNPTMAHLGQRGRVHLQNLLCLYLSACRFYQVAGFDVDSYSVHICIFRPPVNVIEITINLTLKNYCIFW